MSKYSFEFKVEKYVVYGKHSYRETSRKFNIHQEYFRDIVYIFFQLTKLMFIIKFI